MSFVDRIANVLGGLSPAEKLREYERICDGKPDAIYILSRGVKRTGTVGRLKSSGYTDTDIHGSQGGAFARSVAGAELHPFFPGAEVIPTTNIQTEQASSALVMAKELANMKVPDDKILLQEESYSTYTELIEMVRMALERNWKHIVVLANEFQIERTRAMYEHIGELRDPGGYWNKDGVQEAIATFKALPDVKVTFVSAEDVLSLKSPRHKKLVDAVKEMFIWQWTMERELEGARQIRAGEYWNGKEPKTTVRR